MSPGSSGSNSPAPGRRTPLSVRRQSHPSRPQEIALAESPRTRHRAAMAVAGAYSTSMPMSSMSESRKQVLVGLSGRFQEPRTAPIVATWIVLLSDFHEAIRES